MPELLDAILKVIIFAGGLYVGWTLRKTRELY